MGFCEVITTLLDTDAHDQRDTILSAMRNLNNVCNQETYYLTVSDFLRKFQVSLEYDLTQLLSI